MTSRAGDIGVVFWDLAHLDFTNMDLILSSLVETVSIAVLSLLYSLILGIIFGMLAARNVFRLPWLSVLTQSFFTFLRAVPTPVWVLLMLVCLGMFYFVGYNNPVGEYNAPEHTETLIYLMYAMFGICVAVTVIGAIAQFGAALRDNPKSAIKSLIGLVLFVVVLVVSYGMGSDSPVVLADGSAYTDTGWLKITDMLIYSIYFLFGVAAIGTLVNLSGIFKR